MRTRAENDEATAVWNRRLRSYIWRRRMKTEYGWSSGELRLAIFALGGHICLCGRGAIVGDGACWFCMQDEDMLARELTEEEITRLRRDDYAVIAQRRAPLPGQVALP